IEPLQRQQPGFGQQSGPNICRGRLWDASGPFRGCLCPASGIYLGVFFIVIAAHEISLQISSPAVLTLPESITQAPVALAKRLNEQRIRFAAALMPYQFTTSVWIPYSLMPAANRKPAVDLSGQEKAIFTSAGVGECGCGGGSPSCARCDFAASSTCKLASR